MKLPLIFTLVFALLAGSYTTPVEDTKTTIPPAVVKADAIAASDAAQAETNPEIASEEYTVEAIDASDDFTAPVAEPKTVVNAIAAGTPKDGKITAEKAKEIALSHAGLAGKKVRDLEADFDRERGKKVYEVSFESGKFDYEYKIDAETGTILTVDKERDD